MQIINSSLNVTFKIVNYMNIENFNTLELGHTFCLGHSKWQSIPTEMCSVYRSLQ